MPLPTGLITLLFTDIEGSTRLWELYPDAMPAAMARHDAIIGGAVSEARGVVFRTVGDAFFAAFARATDGVTAALAAQRGLFVERWEAMGLPKSGSPALRVRMALHTSDVELRDGDYFGPPLNRVSRLMSAGHGGQTLLCNDTVELVRDQIPPDVTLRDMGEHQLKDLNEMFQIYQLDAADLPQMFPPLKTLTVAAGALPRDVRLSQTKLPGMPGVDYDALWRKEQADRRRRRKGKEDDSSGGGLF